MVELSEQSCTVTYMKWCASCSGLSHIFEFEPLSRARSLFEAIIRQIHIILNLWQYLLNGLSQIKSAFVWWKYINQLWFIRLDYDVNSCCEHKAGYGLGVLLDIESKKEAQLSFLLFWLNQYKQCIIIPACVLQTQSTYSSISYQNANSTLSIAGTSP